MKIKDYLNDMLNQYGVTDLLEDTLSFFESREIQLKPLQLACIIYIAAMQDMEAVKEVFEHLEDLHFREE